MRQQGLPSLDAVETIIVEHNGAISVLPKEGVKEQEARD